MSQNNQANKLGPSALAARSQEQELRELICEIGKLLYDRGHVVTNDGNISAKLADDTILVTPSGVSKGRMTPDMMVLIDQDGKILRGNRYPSSEHKMHLTVYRHRPDVKAVVHAHSPLATAFAVCRRPIEERYAPEMLAALGPVPVAEFALPSTDAVPRSIEPYLADHRACLLANHGVIAWAEDLWGAFDTLEVVEAAARLIMNVEQLGNPQEISAEDAATIMSFMDKYRKLKQTRTD